MKTITYASGVSGGILILIAIYGLFVKIPGNAFILVAGLVLFFFIFLPLFILDRRKENRKVDQIIQRFRNQEKEKSKLQKSKYPPTGWSMNNSPFRDRRSGLSWGGGNVHAANASRNKRRSFLK